ncbi:hypothetical protein [Prevotella melaninogenica]|jgi:hypothetical protein|uniref:hypothetical protein n=1 Tax=Prevotella melaninogenica TaxID=28132 RepID=UPI0028E70AA5|nr:hypothetical protein [Prevotella melaninogenica]
MDPSVIIDRIKKLKSQGKYLDVQYSVQSLGNGACICILRGGFNRSDSKDYMERVVLDICQNNMRYLFVESHLDIPNVKVIIFDLDNIPFLV